MTALLPVQPLKVERLDRVCVGEKALGSTALAAASRTEAIWWEELVCGAVAGGKEENALQGSSPPRSCHSAILSRRKFKEQGGFAS
jgi:hypothetical protein